MNESTKTKKALRGSLFALFLCIVLLIGTTFAWFTDTASTGVNKIQAGNLKVDIVDTAGSSLEGKTLNFTNKDNSTDILWEPGVRFKTPEFQIKNNGNLALKYKLSLNGVTGDSELLDVITFSVVDGSGNEVNLDTFEGHLTKDETLSGAFYIQGHMDEAAGNEYQNKTLEGLSLTVVATQDTVENDSFNNEYDKNAQYTEVIAGGKAFISGTHTLNTGITVTDKNAVAVKASGKDTNVIITGGSFDGGSGGNNRCIEADSDATVTIKDGMFTVGGDADGLGNSVVLCKGGNIVIEGGFFYTNYGYRGKYYVLNQQNDDPGTITVKGGTFVNYDPSTGDDNLGGNFVADGYEVTTETKANGDVWYTVVPKQLP